PFGARKYGSVSICSFLKTSNAKDMSCFTSYKGISTYVSYRYPSAPISCSASAIFCTIWGWRSAHSPFKKNVAFTLCLYNISSMSLTFSSPQLTLNVRATLLFFTLPFVKATSLSSSKNKLELEYKKKNNPTSSRREIQPKMMYFFLLQKSHM